MAFDAPEKSAGDSGNFGNSNLAEEARNQAYSIRTDWVPPALMVAGGATAGGLTGTYYGLVGDCSLYALKTAADTFLTGFRGLGPYANIAAEPVPFEFSATRILAGRGMMAGGALGLVAALGYYELKKHSETGNWF